MQAQPQFSDLRNMLAAGSFRDARTEVLKRHVELHRLDPIRCSLIIAELDLAEGLLQSARTVSEHLLLEERVDLDLRISSHRIIAEVYAQGLEFEDSLKHFNDARLLTKDGGTPEQCASIALSFWRTFSGIFPLETAEPDFSIVRRAVVRGGLVHHLVELHLCACRIEARKGGLLEARRHWNAADRLLRGSPNRKIQSQLELDGCLLSLLSGDLRCALDASCRAEIAAKESGYFRSEIAALIDRAHILHALGDLTGARDLATKAARRGAEHLQLRTAALDCLANVLISGDDAAGAEAAFDEIASLKVNCRANLSLHWDVLSEIASQVRLSKLKGRQAETDALVSKAVATAQASKDSTWLARMQLELGELRARSGDFETAERLTTTAIRNRNLSPELLARLSRTVALTSLAEGNVEDATNAYQRSLRIANFTENITLGVDLQISQLEGLRCSGGRSLDDAVALIELAGYPHVLAREAFALIEMSGAAHAQALVARGSAVRCLAARNWTEAEAVAAAKTPGDRLQIVCGTHRDESWEVIAETKPGLHDRCTAVALQKLVDTAVTLDRFRREEKQRAALWPADTMETDGGLWVSEQMLELLAIARRIAPSNISVLLTGETGTGKEVLARAIHRASARGAKPFIPFNCTAVPRDMLESQLFGYRKGAFTGADAPFDGVIRAAAGGTLFLDEIAEIGPELQPKLLRFLETHEVHGLGEPQPVKVDVRVIAATNADVETLVAGGRMREDLFYRLNVARLRLPPLRERREEIPPLIDYYLRKSADEQKKGHPTVDDETLEYLVLYPWPGNVRQLVNEISRIMAFVEPDGRITPALLSPDIQASRRTVRVLPGDEPEIRIRLDQPLGDAVDLIEQMMIRRALERARGNYERAARLLGISRKGLFLKRRRWGLERAS
jgi:transcriptional regulator with PAS, ATPase and Fis domain